MASMAQWVKGRWPKPRTPQDMDRTLPLIFAKSLAV